MDQMRSECELESGKDEEEVRFLHWFIPTLDVQDTSEEYAVSDIYLHMEKEHKFTFGLHWVTKLLRGIKSWHFVLKIWQNLQ